MVQAMHCLSSIHLLPNICCYGINIQSVISLRQIQGTPKVCKFILSNARLEHNAIMLRRLTYQNIKILSDASKTKTKYISFGKSVILCRRMFFWTGNLLGLLLLNIGLAKARYEVCFEIQLLCIQYHNILDLAIKEPGGTRLTQATLPIRRSSAVVVRLS